MLYGINYIHKEVINSSYLPSQDFATVDFETSLISVDENKRDDKGKILPKAQTFYCGAIFDKNVVKVYDNIESIIDYMIKADTKIYYFHNLSFDYRFILEYLFENYSITMIPRGSHMLRIDVYPKDCFKFEDEYCLFSLLDSFAVLPHSLLKLSESFCIRYKKIKSFDIKLIEQYWNGTKKQRQEVIKYLCYDVLSLYEALTSFMDKMDLNKLSITITCSARRKWEKFYPKHKYIKIFPSYEDNIRSAYFGARTEVFNMYCKKGYYYDFNSLYPDRMFNNSFPIGNPEKFKNIIPKDMTHYFAYVTINIPNNTFIPPLPFKDKSGKLFFPTGKITGWYNSVDVELCRELGYNIKIHNGFGWTESEYIFSDYVRHYYNIKKNAKKNGDKALYEIAKLMQNSLYGKFGEKKIRQNIVKVSSFNNLIKLIKNNKKPYCISKKYNIFAIEKIVNASFCTTHISAFVTSYARKKLFLLLNKIHNTGGNIYYCDTDSVITDQKQATSLKLGDLELEYKVKDGYLALPKLYCFQNPMEKKSKDKIVIKCKGLNYNQVSYDDIKDFVLEGKKITSNSVRISTLKQILRMKLDYTDCYNLERNVKYKPEIFKRYLNEKNKDDYKTYPFNVNELIV